MIGKNNKFILFVAMYLSILTSCTSQKLVYEPIGIMDKPLPTIEIVLKNNQKSDNDKIFVIDKDTFEKLLNYIQNQFDEKSNKFEDEYGCYLITYHVGSKKYDYILNSKSKSVIFFSGQIDIIKSNKDLYQELEVLLKRLK